MFAVLACDESTHWQIVECRGLRNCFMYDEKNVSKFMCEAVVAEMTYRDEYKYRACINTR